jgi:methylmalonyl-CoA/ethylmalonyl-CoA epimerase
MQPLGDEGPLARHLAHRGPGLHHVGLATEDMEAEVARLKSRGLTFVREPHRFHADREIRALLVPRDCEGVLVELVQPLPRSPR